MNGDFASRSPLERAKDVEATYRVNLGLYLIGSLERGLTVYNQQVRSHNLVWALWELHKPEATEKPYRIAVVGGGIAGLTAAACFLSLFKAASLTLFEQLWDLCPIQQGADSRWLHPRIYDWPKPGSRAPGASLPVLNWSEGRASDVARTIIGEFSRFVDAFDRSGSRLNVLLGSKDFSINTSANEITWTANRAVRAGAFFHLGKEERGCSAFDIIVLAAGFGLETSSPVYPTASYWRNEQFGQPLLKGTRQNFLISGFGDGALIDLSRLTIERYRQDTILYELFPGTLEGIEDTLLELWTRPEQNVFQMLTNLGRDGRFKKAREELSTRIRKDTNVALHISGKEGNVQGFSELFGPKSSFTNRMITFLLNSCDAFSISIADLPTAVAQHGAAAENVLCRYGTKPLAHLLTLFSDAESVQNRLTQMKARQEQLPLRLWQPGAFPYPS